MLNPEKRMFDEVAGIDSISIWFTVGKPFRITAVIIT